MPADDNVALRVTRGSRVESLHRAHVAVADASGQLVASFGDPDFRCFLRSVAKPFQAAPLITTGAADEFGLTDAELAVIAGSHSGQDAHVQAVRSVLDKAGVSEAALACGAHAPYHQETADALQGKHGRIHNNCSGKHAGMLALATHLGEPTEGYLDPDHPVQRRVRDAVATALDLPSDDLGVAVDGCGAPTFHAPLSAGARAVARLGDPSGLPGDLGDALARVGEAMARNPWFVAGSGRLDTELCDSSQGLASKSGAEAVQAVANRETGVGLVLKIEDGSKRGVPPATVECLRQLGWLDERAFETLGDRWRPTITNHAGRAVGSITPVLELDVDASIAPQAL